MQLRCGRAIDIDEVASLRFAGGGYVSFRGVAGGRLIVDRYAIQAVVEEFAETRRAVA